MSDYNILSEEPVSITEAFDAIGKKEGKDELTYREEKSLEYLKKFKKVSIEDLPKIKEEIEGLEIPRLESEHIIKIIDIMPKSGTELRAIVSNSGTVLVDESVTKILDVLNKYRA